MDGSKIISEGDQHFMFITLSSFKKQSFELEHFDIYSASRLVCSVFKSFFSLNELWGQWSFFENFSTFAIGNHRKFYPNWLRNGNGMVSDKMTIFYNSTVFLYGVE